MKERDLLKLIAAGIRRCRKEQGLTIEKLAEISGVDAGFLAHIETAKKNPSLSVLAKITDGLDVAPEELFWTDRVSEDQLGRRMRVLLDRLNLSQQRDVLSIISKLRGSANDIRALKTLLRA